MRFLVLLLALSACVVVPVPISTKSAQVRTLSAATAPDAAFDAQLQAARSRPIAYNARLAAVARAHAADMQARGYVGHVSPEGKRAGDRAAAAGIPACGIGENVGQGQGSSAEIFAAWMKSRGHRRNMLNPKMASYGLGRAGDHWVLVLYTPC